MGGALDKMPGNGCIFFKDEVDQIIGKYGPMIIKFIVVQEGTDLINSEFAGIKNKAIGFLDGKVKEVLQLAGVPIQSVDGLVGQIRGKIDSQIPGGLTALQSLKGDKLQNMLGVAKIKTDMQTYVEQAGQQVKEKSTGVIGLVENGKMDVVAQLQKEKPQVPIYDDLPEFIQRGLYQRVKEESKDQIAKQKDEWLDKLKSKTDVTQLAQNILEVPALNSLKSKVTQVQQQFEGKFKQFQSLFSMKDELMGGINKIKGFF